MLGAIETSLWRTGQYWQLNGELDQKARVQSDNVLCYNSRRLFVAGRQVGCLNSFNFHLCFDTYVASTDFFCLLSSLRRLRKVATAEKQLLHRLSHADYCASDNFLIFNITSRQLPTNKETVSWNTHICWLCVRNICSTSYSAFSDDVTMSMARTLHAHVTWRVDSSPLHKMVLPLYLATANLLSLSMAIVPTKHTRSILFPRDGLVIVTRLWDFWFHFVPNIERN